MELREQTRIFIPGIYRPLEDLGLIGETDVAEVRIGFGLPILPENPEDRNFIDVWNIEFDDTETPPKFYSELPGKLDDIVQRRLYPSQNSHGWICTDPFDRTQVTKDDLNVFKTASCKIRVYQTQYLVLDGSNGISRCDGTVIIARANPEGLLERLSHLDVLRMGFIAMPETMVFTSSTYRNN